MKDKSIIIKILELFTLIIIYHITKSNNLFLYTITLSLYNIFLSCFSHITLKEKIKNINDDYSKLKILKYTSISITIVSLIFVILSIFISDIINTSLNIQNTFMPCLFMGISIITEPLIKILLEYLESYNRPKLANGLFKIYYIIEYLLLLIICLTFIKFIKIPIHISISLFYLSKIISFIIVSIFICLSIKKIKLNIKKKHKELHYKKEIKEILTINSQKSIVNIVKNSYYYISIILLYLVLSTRYKYNIELIENNITFIYLYCLYIINFTIDLTLSLIDKKDNVINYIYKTFENIIIIAITIGITAPLICKIIFLSHDNSMYLGMLSILSIFITLFKVTVDNVKNNKVIYISLITGILSKVILTIPLINSFYRMGYDLIYGDIISTIISLCISLIINYIYIKLNNKKEKTLENILSTLYVSILLSIILVVIQFIIPIKVDSYFKSILIFILYITISIIFIKYKKKERG